MLSTVETEAPVVVQVTVVVVLVQLYHVEPAATSLILMVLPTTGAELSVKVTESIVVGVLFKT
jgi:hypothetical protein